MDGEPVRMGIGYRTNPKRTLCLPVPFKKLPPRPVPKQMRRA
jgi:hypothetical protein